MAASTTSPVTDVTADSGARRTSVTVVWASLPGPVSGLRAGAAMAFSPWAGAAAEGCSVGAPAVAEAAEAVGSAGDGPAGLAGLTPPASPLSGPSIRSPSAPVGEGAAEPPGAGLLTRTSDPGTGVTDKGLIAPGFVVVVGGEPGRAVTTRALVAPRWT